MIICYNILIIFPLKRFVSPLPVSRKQYSPLKLLTECYYSCAIFGRRATMLSTSAPFPVWAFIYFAWFTDFLLDQGYINAPHKCLSLEHYVKTQGWLMSQWGPHVASTLKSALSGIRLFLSIYLQEINRNNQPIGIAANLTIFDARWVGAVCHQGLTGLVKAFHLPLKKEPEFSR